jgi:radical SAM-linked protein
MRLRLRFAKEGKIRFTSHRDVARMWERAFPRADLPLAYSSGYSPRPRVSFGLALPTGYESDGEYIDLDLVAPVPLEGLCARLSALLPEGVDATAAAEIDPGEASLQEAVTSCTWTIDLPGPTPAEAAQRVAEVLAATELPVARTRKGVEAVDDVRPGIRCLEVVGPLASPPGTILTAELAATPRALRPSELVAAGWPGLELLRARRTHQWIERDGARVEPLGLGDGATSAPHAGRRAS